MDLIEASVKTTMGVGQGGSQPAITGQQAKLMARKVPPAMRERGMKSLARLDALLGGDYFGPKEKGFKKSLEELRGVLSDMLCGIEPYLRKYDRAAIEAFISKNHEVRIGLCIDGGKPLLCPELECALSALLYTMNANDTGRVGLIMGKDKDGGMGIILMTGASLKNFSPDVLPAAMSVVELLNGRFRPNGMPVSLPNCAPAASSNGVSVTILVPLPPDGALLAI